ncbi:sugar ABC transporter permease [Paenibacillus swuensis]|uniref:Sugar ABC transporter permease n=1 Tax=Paenibacillus swuensis TaxID=1178515 RepID=A0A172THP0_9BACL|nr:carbohydrate ABC transporter permease [Paenibacillus swuensis]ANE46404.1 sugar ABC transporter permease [Paenibacillus swuensis]
MKNRNRASTHPAITVFFLISSVACIIPFWLVLVVSLTNQDVLDRDGYRFWPAQWDLTAYQYLANDAEPIVRAYGVSIFVTLTGVVLSLIITSAMAYTLSRKDFPLQGFLSFFVFFTMLFNGGLLPWYLVYTRMLNLQDTLLALIIPGLLSGFNVLIMRTFFTNSIPPSLIDSAQMDGASEYRTYYSIILPLSLPVMATIGLFTTVAYWNDWFTSLVFINNQNLYSLQYFLQKTLMNDSFLANLASTSSMANSTIKTQPPLESIRMAMAILAIGPIALVFPFIQKYFVKGLTVGAVKG